MMLEAGAELGTASGVGDAGLEWRCMWELKNGVCCVRRQAVGDEVALVIQSDCKP